MGGMEVGRWVGQKLVGGWGLLVAEQSAHLSFPGRFTNSERCSLGLLWPADSLSCPSLLTTESLALSYTHKHTM